MTFHRSAWDLRTVTRTVLSCTPDEVHLHAQLDGYENNRRIHSQNWHLSIPPDHL
ncbi:MAG: hypothetical protein ACRDOO_06835 [Actinomadura sp.]